MAPATITQKFNRGLSPRVRITEMQPPGSSDASCNDGQVAYFTTTSGPGSTVVVDASNRQYGIVWKTKTFANVGAPCVYRMAVELSGAEDVTVPHVELGFADVQIIANGSMKNLVTDDFVSLLDDGSLPFKFFIGHGAAFFALTGDDACRAGRDCGEGVAPPNQNTTILSENKLAGVFIPANAIGDNTVVVTIEQRTDRPCIPTSAMPVPQFDDCYRYEAFRVENLEIDRVSAEAFQAEDQEFNTAYRFNADVTVGMCVELGELTLDQARRLQIFRFEPNGEGQAEALPNASATFLPCDPGFQPGSSGGTAGIFRHGWQFVVKGLRELIGPRTLYASTSVIHFGLGGSTCCMSYFTWGLPEAVPQLYGVNSGDDGLSTYDVATGARAFVGRLGGSNLNLYTTPVAMAVGPTDGTLFTWNNTGDGSRGGEGASTGDLLTVDKCSGLATKVNASPSGRNIGALAFAAGVLYGAEDFLPGEGDLTSRLVTIAASSGAVSTPIGPIGLRVGGMDADASGTLYGLELTTTGSQRLVTINKTTGAGTVVATLSQNVGVAGALVFTPSGTLIGSGFGGPSGDILFDVNPSTGAVSNVRTTSSSPQGMGFAPPCGG